MRIRIIGKKAQVFILVAIALIALFTVSYGVYSTIQDRSTVNTRINTMDSFLFSVEKDLSRQMYVVGHRGLFMAEANVTATGNYINNMTSYFNSIFFNDIPYNDFCNSSNLNESIMCGARYIDLLYENEDSINNKARNMNININVTRPSIVIYQANPWNMGINFQFDLFMDDSSGLASWKKRASITSEVSIEGFEDPLYLIKTGGRVATKVRRTIYEGNYTSGSDVTNLRAHLDNGYYAQNTNAPSFLGRLQGNLSADTNGIESFVDNSKLEQQRVETKTKSSIDYIYFDDYNNPSYSSVSGMPNWFRIDDSHKAKYNITG